MLNLLADAEDDHQTSSLIHHTSVVHEFLTLQGMVWRYLVALRRSRCCRLGLCTRLYAYRILHYPKSWTIETFKMIMII
jgi:hypothetical protein